MGIEETEIKGDDCIEKERNRQKRMIWLSF